jgi:hypothetical protein
VFLVGGPDSEKRLPGKDRNGIYYIDGNLMGTDKSAVKD